MEFARPGKEHEWLEALLGTWTVTAPMPCGEGEEPRTVEWTETVRSLQGLWYVAEGHGELPDGSPSITLMTLGYDQARERYVGNWVGSMMTHMFNYEGTLDDAGRILTLDCEGPDFMNPQVLRKYQDIITLQDDNKRTLTSRMLTDDGTWQQVMSADYKRTAMG